MNSEKRICSLVFLRWLDSDSVIYDRRAHLPGVPNTQWDRWLPFVFLHAGCGLIAFTGSSSVAVCVCVVLYAVRMFAITAFYHRYFSHRAFKTSRFIQLVFALIGASAMQRGPLWWAAHHRTHHRKSDMDGDLHSPVARSFLWSHIGWLTSTKNMITNYDDIKDFSRYAELRLINRFDWVMPMLLLVSLYWLGEALRASHPELHTSGLQLVAWGFFLSTTVLFHATCCINSVAHMFGYRSYDTSDNSRNNPVLALFTFGEGWHNNHHRFSACARQGVKWWEIDITYGVLLLMSKFGLVYDLKGLPKHGSTAEYQSGDDQTSRKAGAA